LVPVVVGTLLAQAARLGLDIPAEVLTGIIEAIVIGLYYVTLAIAEKYVPWAGILLGGIGSPVYPDGLDSQDRLEHDGD
jgi:hypothetical protein